MAGRVSAWVLLVVWAGLIAWSFIAFNATAATGDGILLGVNRVWIFLMWQAIAGATAFIIWLLGRHFPRRSLGRWLCRVPITLFVLLAVGIAGLVAWAAFKG